MYLKLIINKKKLIIFSICLLVLILGTRFALLIIPKFPLIFPGCPFAHFFHLYCPGCGGTRAVALLMHLHPIRSFLYHPVVIYIVFLLSFFYIKMCIILIRHPKGKEITIHLGFLWGALALIIAHFLIRNILLILFNFDYIGDLIQYWHP